MPNKYISLAVLDSLDNEMVEKILTEPYKILCKNFDTEEQEIKTLDELNRRSNFFWRDNKSKWTYYILEEDIYNYSIGKENEPSHVYSDEYEKFVKLSDERRIEGLTRKKNDLKLLELKKDRSNKEVGEALVAGSNETLLLNKVIFDDLLKTTPEKAKEKSKAAVSETQEIVKIASNLLSEFSGDLSIFTEIIEKSNGSTVKHMSRVFILSLSFFKYYNYLLNNTGYVSKVRVDFDEKYRESYEKLLPQFNYDEIRLERVFKDGMRVIPENEKNAIEVGFLLHDLGKQVDLEYFEGSEGYVKERIQAHAENGFNEILKRTVYPPVVSALAGFHHEYYGHKSGYGSFREYIKNKFNKKIFDYCITYSLHDVYNGEAYGFFPAKILEIVDVYDALTDPGRKYREPLKPLGAIKFMREHFLNSDVKLDPILFDIFELYLKGSGELN